MKKIILSAILSVSMYANVNNAVQNMLGSSEYNTHRNLINHIFKNEANFYTAGKLDYTKISQELQKNNLLKLNLGSMQNIEVNFIFNSQAKKSFKNMNDILKIIGQQNFVTISQTVVDDQLKWSVRLRTAAAINPLRLSSELQNVNSRIVDIKKEGSNKWSYYINSDKSSLFKAEDLVTKASVTLRKPVRPYMIELANTRTINIKTNSQDNWYPSIVFYDSNFNLIEVFEDNTLHRNLRVDVPSNTRFVKIDDFYALTNIKNGLTVTKE